MMLTSRELSVQLQSTPTPSYATSSCLSIALVVVPLRNSDHLHVPLSLKVKCNRIDDGGTDQGH